MECICCNYKAKTKGNYEKHLTTSKHIKKEAGEKNPEKENPTIFKERLIRENKDLREVHLQEIKWLKEKHQQEINELKRQLKEKNISFDNMYSILSKKNISIIHNPID